MLRNIAKKLIPHIPKPVAKIIVVKTSIYGRRLMGFSESLNINAFHAHTKEWRKIKGDQTLRLNYDLNENSIVFDIGGYIGEWAEAIFCKYGCRVHIFEPVSSLYKQIQEKFSHNQRIATYPYGLAGKTEQVLISKGGHTSSVYNSTKDNSEMIQMKDISEFLEENSITNIDIMKINIEGGEYDLLERLLQTGQITNIRNIQVQFHDFVPDAEKRMQKILEELQKTHHPTYQYKFVWENWKKND